MSWFVVIGLAALMVARPWETQDQPQQPSSTTSDTGTGTEMADISSIPVCVGVRGNGVRYWSHFTAIARVVESLGPLGAIAGGSSGSLTAFLTESIHSNPLVTSMEDKAEAAARISFLLKTPQGLSELGNLAALLYPSDESLRVALREIAASNILDSLSSADSEVQQRAVEDLVLILKNSIDFLNTEIIQLLESPLDPVRHAQDIIENGLPSWSVESPLVTIRPGLIDIPGFLERTADVVGSFFSGYEPVNLEEMEYMLEQCAVPGLGKDWPDVEGIMTDSGATCGELLSALFQKFTADRDASAHPSRFDDTLGSDAMYSFISAAALVNNATDAFALARSQYLMNAQDPVQWDIDFDDVDFFFWGNEELLERAAEEMPNFNDLKSKKFQPHGQITWKEALQRSMSEPSLGRGIEGGVGDDAFVSIGGWNDLVPAQILEAIGCEDIVLNSKVGGAGSFQTGVAELFGATPEDVSDLNDLSDKNSGWTTGIKTADAVLCSDWDAYNGTDIRGLSNDGWTAPIVTESARLRSLFPDQPEADLHGCTPLLE